MEPEITREWIERLLERNRTEGNMPVALEARAPDIARWGLGRDDVTVEAIQLGEQLRVALEACMEEVRNSRATIGEYEHALEHVIDCGNCTWCRRLARSALAGEHRADYREQ